MNGRAWLTCSVCGLTVRLVPEEELDRAAPAVCHRQRCRARVGDDAGRDAHPDVDPWQRALRYQDDDAVDCDGEE